MDLYSIVIILTFVGFVTLAYLLLAPVYSFLDREEEVSKQWTEEAIARRMREQQAGSNGEHEKESDPNDRPEA